MSTLLVPVDFSPTSERLIEYATALAATRSAQIMLLHAYPIPVAAPDMPAELLLAGEIQDDAKTHMDALVSKLQSQNILVKSKLAAGSPGSETVYCAEDIEPEMVVMGTHASAEHKQRWFGGNALYALERLHTPLLAVPINTVYKPWQRIVCATDFDVHEIDAIKQLVGWLNMRDAQLVLVHINNNDTDAERSSSEYRASFLTKVRELTGMPNINYEAVTTPVNVASELRAFTLFHNADVLVMLHHLHKGLSRLWHHSVTKEMAEHLPVPLLSFPIVEK